jgi:hypothetical protein
VGQEKYRGKRVKYVSHNNYRKGGCWAWQEKTRNENCRDKGLYMIRRQIDASSLCKKDDGRPAEDKAHNHAIIWPFSDCVYAVRLAGGFLEKRV